MKRFFHILSFGLVLFASYFFITFLVKNVGSMPPLKLDLITFFNGFKVIVLYLVIIAICGFIWYLLLLKTGEPVRLMNALIVFSIAQFGRYIPGNIAHHMGRIALARTYGMYLPRVTYVMAVELVWGVASAAFLVTILSLVVGEGILKYLPGAFSTWKVLLIAIVMGLIPLSVGFIFRKWPVLKKYANGNNKIRMPNVIVSSICLLLNMVVFLLMGYIANVIACEVFHVIESRVWLITGFYAVAWIAGLVTPGAPAGLGIREAILIGTLSQIFDAGTALGITISMRVVSIVGDGIAFVAALIIKRSLYPIAPLVQSIK